MARKSWGQLRPGYRRDLQARGRTLGLSEGEVRARHASGDVRALRRHPQKPAKWAAPKEATDRESIGLGTTADYADLTKWRARRSPSWLPTSEAAMGTDTAAILSQIDIPPARWRHVEFTTLQSGQVRMTITPRTGYPREVMLADRDAMSEVTRFIRNPGPTGATPTERKRLEREWTRARPTVNVSYGTPPPGRSPSPGTSPTRARPPRASTKGSKRPSRPASKGSTKSARPSGKKPPGKKTSTGVTAPGPSPLDLVDQALTGVDKLTTKELDNLEREVERLQARIRQLGGK